VKRGIDDQALYNHCQLKIESYQRKLSARNARKNEWLNAVRGSNWPVGHVFD